MMRLLLSLLLLSTAQAIAAEPLIVRGDRLFVQAQVNGHPVEALLDSGAEISLADSGAAPALGLGGGEDVSVVGSGGSQSAWIVPSVRIEALGVAIADTPVGVTDLKDVSARLVGRPVDFILGGELFAARRLRIDIEGGDIAVQPPGDTPEGNELALRDHAGIKAFEVQVGNSPLLADFDLGNGSDVLVSAAAAARLGLEPVGMEPAGGLGGGQLRAVVFIPELRIGGVRFEHVRAHIDPEASAGELNIGVRLLRHFVIVSDFANNRLWLQRREP